MMLILIVGLMLGGAAVYAAYKDQKLGVALGVGAAVLTLFFVVIDKDLPAAQPQTVVPAVPAAPSSTAPPLEASQGHPAP